VCLKERMKSWRRTRNGKKGGRRGIGGRGIGGRERGRRGLSRRGSGKEVLTRDIGAVGAGERSFS